MFERYEEWERMTPGCARSRREVTCGYLCRVRTRPRSRAYSGKSRPALLAGGPRRDRDRGDVVDERSGR